MRRLYIIVLFVFATLEIFAQSPSLLTQYTTDNGLSQNIVSVVFKDKKGLMWFGTWDGLNKFDGYDFTIYKANNDPMDGEGLINTRIKNIKESGDSSLWVRTNDNLLYRFNTRTKKFKRVELPYVGHYWALDAGNVVCNDNDGNIFLVKSSYIPNQITSFSLFQNEGIGKLTSVFMDRNKNVWFLGEKGLALKDSNTKYADANRIFLNNHENESFICALETDKNIFFGTDKGHVYCYNRTSKTFSTLNLEIKSPVTGITGILGKKVVICSENGKIAVIDSSEEGIEYYNIRRHNNIGYYLYKSYCDSHGQVWLFTEKKGVVRFDPESGYFKRFWLNNPNEKAVSSRYSTYYVFEDAFGGLWVRTKGGALYRYNRRDDKLEWFYNNPKDPKSIFNTNIQVSFSDENGIIWLCMGNQGVYKYVQRDRNFYFTSLNSYVKNIDIRAIFQDPEGKCWISSKTKEIFITDKKGKVIGTLGENGKIRRGVFSDKVSEGRAKVYKIRLDKNSRIWLATKGNGIFILTPKNSSYTSFSVKHYVNNKNDKYSLSSNEVYDVFQDRFGRMWIATIGGGLNLVEEKGDSLKFINSNNELKNYPKECSKVRCIDGGKEGYIWFGTTDGFVVFKDDFKDPSAIEYRHFNRSSPGLEYQNIDDVYQILCSSRGETWIGTFGGGLIECKYRGSKRMPVFKIYNKKTGFHTDIILGLLEDNEGNLWITSEKSLARFIPDLESSDIYNVNNGLEKVDFMEGSVFGNRNGDILLGTSTGYYSFSPRDIERNQYSPKIVFTNLKVGGKDTYAGSGDGILEQDIDDSRSIEISHKYRTVAIKFAAIDFKTPENLQYSYRLKGYEDWNALSKRREVLYTGLPAGEYVFQVKSTNSDGILVSNIRNLAVKIKPLFWKTTAALFLYVLVIILFFWVGLSLLSYYIRLKNNVLIEKNLSELKLRFFTDISHELRTPLTLILGPIENVINNEKLSVMAREQLMVVKKNADRMIRVLNQILDFRRIQNKKMRINVSEVQFSKVVTDSYLNFADAAKERNIDYNLIDNTDGVLVWLDKNSLDTIVFNLLSNAFKFTEAGGKITVDLSGDNDNVILKVIDTGSGMDEKTKEKIFSRFYSKDSAEEAGKRSTGIGLALVRELISLHNASIRVNSEPGKGSEFIVAFRLGVAHFGKNADFILDDKEEGSGPVPLEDISVCREEESDDMGMVLIAEDNNELRKFLKSVLSKKFRVAEAVNGKEAWQMTQSIMPDFIVTDLMMPVESGKELLRKVCSTDSTCHIPVIVLTAKMNMESKLECLDMGADDYITKPFSATFLEARISSLLKRRRKMRQVNRNRIVSDEKIDIKVPSPEKFDGNHEFMDKTMEVMENNISNSALSVDQLCSEAGYGRTVFFNKLKSLTGLSPNEYIKEVRIKRAAQLLEMGEHTISQITYMVGMNDSRYFSRCFKQKYNMTPSAYKSKFGKKQES